MHQNLMMVAIYHNIAVGENFDKLCYLPVFYPVKFQIDQSSQLNVEHLSYHKDAKVFLADTMHGKILEG